jgi:uncharacterized membrane protein
MATRQTPSKTGKPGASSQSPARSRTAAPAAARNPAKASARSSSASAKTSSSARTGKAAPAKTSKGAPAKASGKGSAATGTARTRKAAPAAPARRSPQARIAGAWPAVAQWSLWARIARAWRAAVDWSGGGVPFATMIVSVLGLADSIYMTVEHFSTHPSFICPANSTINCLKVTTSAWSWLPAGPVSWSIPVSVAGLAFYIFMVAINSRWGWRASWPVVHWVRLVSLIVGMLLVLYLVWAELFRIGAICLFCTGVHVLTFVLFALVVSSAAFFGVRAVPNNR